MKTNTTTNTLRVLMQTRANALTHPGGDTVVMDELKRCLETLGHTVEVDLEGERQPRDYDLVHLFNLTLSDLTEIYARRAVEQNTPFVVTALYEDWPKFFNQMYVQHEFLRDYVLGGQTQFSPMMLEQALRSTQGRDTQNNAFTIEHAQAVIVSGEAEEQAIRRDYPTVKNIEHQRHGFKFPERSDGGKAFQATYGVKDFVLCVGRLETRKNQLMLLKALEHTDLPLVFATGGFAYQPEYDELARKFKRSAPTLFLPRLSSEMMASAYAAARVHALPSWYELPGLVSLEAATFEKNIVVSDLGTARDYFGDSAFYCRPDNVDSITNSVLAAYYSPVRKELAERVAQFTWEEAATQVVEIYQNALYRHRGAHPVVGVVETIAEEVTQLSASVGAISRAIPQSNEEQEREEQALQIVQTADRLAKTGESQHALKLYHEAAKLSPTLARAQRGIGVIHLTNGKLELASSAFRRALILDPADILSKTGLGATVWEEGKQREAFDLWREVLSVDPVELTTIYYFINACYTLDRLGDLEIVLNRYCELQPGNTELRFCLAGCLFKQGKDERAEKMATQILAVSPNHAHTKELLTIIAERKRDAASLAQQVTMERVVPVSASGSFAEMVTRIEESHRQRQYDEALSTIATITDSSTLSTSERALLQTLRGEALACKGSLVEAESEFCQAESDPECGYRATTGRGVIAASRGQWSDAEAYFNKAVVLSKRGDVALAGLGLCSMNRGEEETAWEFFQRSLTVNPENKRAILGVLQLGYAMNRLEGVERALEGYLGMNPVDLDMVYSYAGCLYAQKRYADAVRELQKIRLFEPEHQLAAELLEKIQSTESVSA